MVTRKNAAPAVKVAAKPAAKPAAKLAAAKPAVHPGLKKAIAAAGNGAHKRVAKANTSLRNAEVKTNAAMAPAVPTVSSPYLFALGQVVEISASREEGIVRARGEFHHGPNQYLLAYTTALGAYATIWIDEDLLEA